MTVSSPAAGSNAEVGEICAICGKDAGNAAFCHFFREGNRIVLCSLACAETFLRENRDTSALQRERNIQREASRDYDRNPPWWK